MIRQRRCGNLVKLDELGRRCCRFTARVPIGLRAVPIALITGTVGRCCDFDRCFNAIRPHLRRPVDAVRRAFPDGAVPPIDVFKLDDEYFVTDGHKRVAAARGAGAEYVDAEVTEIRARPRV
jgi:ParB/Sulfiredoxin domain